MKRAPWLLLVLLVPSLAAQTAIPTTLFAEQAAGAPVAQVVAHAGRSAIASNGETFLVATAKDTGADAFQYAMTLVDRDGKPIVDSSYVTSDCGGDPAVASDGNGFLAVYGCRGATHGVLFSRDGSARPLEIHGATRADADGQDVSGTRRVAWDGNHYVVVTTIEQGSAKYDVATFVSPNGEIVATDVALGITGTLAIAARNGVSVVIAPGLSMRTMNTAGVLGAPNQVGKGSAAAVAAGDDGFLVVWSDDAVRGWHLDPSGKPNGTPFVVSTEPSAGGVAVAAAGSSWRIAWRDAQGRIVDGETTGSARIGNARTGVRGEHPALASSASDSMLVWADGTTYARRFGGEAAAQTVHRFTGQQVLAGFDLGPAGPEMTWDEWAFYRTVGVSRARSMASPSPYAAIADGSYVMLGGLARPLVVSGTKAPYAVRFADSAETFWLPSKRLFWTGTGFLAVWTERATGVDPFSHLPLYAQRFDERGIAVDATPLVVGTSYDLDLNITTNAALSSGVFVGASRDKLLVAYVDPSATVQGTLIAGSDVKPLGEIAPPQALANPIEITSDGNDFLVSWISGMKGSSAQLASRRVLANGAIETAKSIDSADGGKDAIATFWTGQNYLMVWAEVVNGGRELSAVRLSGDGALIDPQPQSVGMIEGTNARFAFRNGVFAVAYDRDGRTYWRYAGAARQRAVR